MKHKTKETMRKAVIYFLAGLAVIYIVVGVIVGVINIIETLKL